MKTVSRVSQFKKDYKKSVKAGKDIVHLFEVITVLASGRKLSERYRDHKLTGKYSLYRECHIEPDWLLIYELTPTELTLVRLGSHSELFR